MSQYGKRLSAGDRSIGWWEQTVVVLSHLRFAVGVCVLAAGLLMGSAAIAVADADSSNSPAPGAGGTNASRQGSTTASSPVGDTQRKEIQRVTSTLGSGRQPGQQPSPGAETPEQESGGRDAKDEKDSDPSLPTWVEARAP